MHIEARRPKVAPTRVAPTLFRNRRSHFSGFVGKCVGVAKQREEAQLGPFFLPELLALVEQDIQAWCVVVVGLDEDIQVAVSVEIAEPSLVNALAGGDDRFSEVAFSVAVPDEDSRLGCGAGLAHLAVIALEDFSYVVVLADRGKYVLLWTAYCVEKNRRRRKLEKEFKAYTKSQNG